MSNTFYKLDIPEFKNVWIKDESFNPTGTHKDRMAKKIVDAYKNFPEKKSFSIISSGSSAVALQTLFRTSDIPNLKVLLDYSIDEKIKKKLLDIGCEVYEHDLSKEALNREDILSLTKNESGIDLTSETRFSPFYTDIAEEIEILPDIIFIPLGTGELYLDIKTYYQEKHHDCKIFGATTKDKNSKADKLFSFHSPFSQVDTTKNIYHVDEIYLDQAMDIAQEK
jgi:cysteine synthase